MKTTLLTLLLSAFLMHSVFAQTDTIYFSQEDLKKELDSLEFQFKKEINDKYNLALTKSNGVRKQLLDSITTLNARIDQLDNLIDQHGSELSENKSQISTTKTDLKSVKSETENKFTNLLDRLNLKTLISYVLVGLSAFLAIGLFIFLRKRLTSDTSKLDNQIEKTKSALHEENMKLDQKLVDLYETQLRVQKEEMTGDKAKEVEIDHTLALKVADEIVRMQKNIGNMPEETKGLKQLSKALERIQDTFKVNGYEMVGMIGKTYNEGMRVVANFIPDENLNIGEQIITRIIKPQVNFNEKMIQAAQIEVSVGEK